MKQKPHIRLKDESPALFSITAKGDKWYITQHFIERFHKRIADHRIRTIRYITQFFNESFEVEKADDTSLEDHLADSTMFFYNNGYLIITQKHTILTCHPYPVEKLIFV